MELRLPRSGEDGPRFADIKWIPVEMKACGSPPIMQQRQEKATSRRCSSLFLSKAGPQEEPIREHTTVIEVLEYK